MIGKGAFGTVNLALHILSGKLVAIKSFNKKNITKDKQLNKITQEIEILKMLHHPNISQ